MKLNILYLGKLKEITNVSRETIEVEQGIAVQSLINELTVKYPLLAFESFQISADRNLVAFSDSLNEEVDVALLPPFAGG